MYALRNFNGSRTSSNSAVFILSGCHYLLDQRRASSAIIKENVPVSTLWKQCR